MGEGNSRRLPRVHQTPLPSVPRPPSSAPPLGYPPRPPLLPAFPPLLPPLLFPLQPRGAVRLTRAPRQAATVTGWARARRTRLQDHRRERPRRRGAASRHPPSAAPRPPVAPRARCYRRPGGALPRHPLPQLKATTPLTVHVWARDVPALAMARKDPVWCVRLAFSPQKYDPLNRMRHPCAHPTPWYQKYWYLTAANGTSPSPLLWHSPFCGTSQVPTHVGTKMRRPPRTPGTPHPAGGRAGGGGVGRGPVDGGSATGG